MSVICVAEEREDNVSYSYLVSSSSYSIVMLRRLKEWSMSMETVSYERILEEAKRLDPTDQLRLLEDIAHLIREKSSSGRCRSLLELAGLGKEVWQHIDAQNYVDAERKSWNG